MFRQTTSGTNLEFVLLVVRFPAGHTLACATVISAAALLTRKFRQQVSRIGRWIVSDRSFWRALAIAHWAALRSGMQKSRSGQAVSANDVLPGADRRWYCLLSLYVRIVTQRRLALTQN